VNCAFGRLQIAFGKERMKELGIKVDEDEVKKLALGLKKEVTVKSKIRKKTESELLAEARRKLTYKLARKHGARCCLYVFRHSWCIDRVRPNRRPGRADPQGMFQAYRG
jgi:hypothetical protein